MFRPRKCRLTQEEIVSLYTIQHLTCQQIADQAAVSKTHISRLLQRFGISSTQGTWVTLPCSFCGRTHAITRKRWKLARDHYCTRECYYASRENIGYKPWRQGQRLARAIVAQYFDLQSEHVVHHKDDDCRNNDRANLAVYASQADHLKAAHHNNSSVLPIWDGAELSELSR
jgi:DNA-binding transcriptional regulator LsrR (DeoR family)